MQIQDLQHFTVGNQASGPFILILQDGAVITAEDRAMIQAMYSRSPASVITHLEKLAKVGSGKFMDQFYVGYGHKSIGDCGDTTIFIEGVSMLVAKAVQDSMLYDGQEVSTRYLDFAVQSFVNPLGFSVAENPQEKLRQFYVEAMPLLKVDLMSRYPRDINEKEDVYNKTIAARAFDILRGYLPAGAQTNLAWTTNLRQAADRLAILRAHPLTEVRVVVDMLEVALKKAHPHSFNQKRYPASDGYRLKYMENSYYFDPDYFNDKVTLTQNSLSPDLLRLNRDVITSRPDKTELPKALAEIGTLQFEFTLDFGSYRDIARQRAVSQRMPLLTAKHGFHEWYIDQLPVEIQKSAQALKYYVRNWWRKNALPSEADKKVLQYYLPMGYRVPCRVTGDLPAHVYLAELRSGVTVHATLREIAQDMGAIIEGLGVPVYIDKTDSGRFDVKRGNQDIVAKST
jgi:thymidylate synthase ThyX